MAPSFDHASSLGRELLDDRRQRLLSERQFGKYSEKARGGIFWKPEDAHAISPLQLVRRGAASHPDFFRASIEPLRNVERGSFERNRSTSPGRLDVRVGEDLRRRTDVL